MCSWRDLARLSPGQQVVASVVDFRSYLRWGGGRLRSRALQPFHSSRLPNVRVRHYTLGSCLFPESILLSACFPSSPSKIDVIVGTPSDVLVGCARPVPRQS